MSHCLLLAPTAGGALIRCTHPAVSLSDTGLSWEVLSIRTSLLSRLLCTPIIVLHWDIKGLCFVAGVLVGVLLNSYGKFGAEYCKETSSYSHVSCVPLSFSRVPNL